MSWRLTYISIVKKLPGINCTIRQTSRPVSLKKKFGSVLLAILLTKFFYFPHINSYFLQFFFETFQFSPMILFSMLMLCYNLRTLSYINFSFDYINWNRLYNVKCDFLLNQRILKLPILEPLTPHIDKFFLPRFW